MKSITFHINNEAYTLDIGEDPDNQLANSLKKFLTTDKNLSTMELLLAYARKSEELLSLENEIKVELGKLPSLESYQETSN